MPELDYKHLLMDEWDEGHNDPSHDLVNVNKDASDRNKASFYSAERALFLLSAQDLFSDRRLKVIHHAIHAHSFSAGITPQTLKAKIIQDADRLDALGV